MTIEQGGFPGTSPITIPGGPVRPGSMRRVLASPLYRGAVTALFLSGIGQAAAVPLMSRFLVDDLGASLQVAGLFYLTNLTAPVAGYLIGRWSDRSGQRLGLFRWCSLLGGASWLVMAVSQEVWVPFVVGAVGLGISGVAGSQLFAAVHDEIEARREPAGDGIVSIVRMALTAGWVIGPVIGAIVGSVIGPRWTFVGTAVCVLAQLLPVARLRLSPAAQQVAAATGQIPVVVPGMTLRRLWPLLAFTGLFVLVFLADAVRYSYLPIFMDELGMSPLVAGLAIGVQPGVELVLMPFTVLLARRFGPLPLMIVGAACYVAADAAFAGMANEAGVWVGQLLIGVSWGVFAALGILVAQRLLPGAVATASAVFMSAPAITSALGGVLGGFGVAALGVPAVFWIPAVTGALGVLGFCWLAGSRVGRLTR